jgi:tetratricopeptide (TPR) repeat protein
MYCPSCDKKYGAIHSRCPECHSWLKVSAPASHRGGSASKPAPTQPPVAKKQAGGVSTLDRGESVPWADAAPVSEGTQWSDASSDSWGDDAFSTPLADMPASSDSWGGGGDSSSSWGGVPQAATSATATPAGAGNGWLAGQQAAETGGLAGEPPATRAPAAAPAPSSQGNGWLGDAPETVPMGAVASPSTAAPSSSWLGGHGPEELAQEPGWLGHSAPETTRPKGGGGGWLGDPQPSDGPSMTEMVDQAISVEDEHDFVDDSWVDEEIRDNEFDELDVPEFVPPPPEVGGTFLKMLLVAVLVVLVGGGVLFFKSDSKSSQKSAAEETSKKLVFARNAVAGGKEDLANNRAELAIPQFQEALVTLSEVKADQKEIYEAEILLSRALMGAQEYEDAITHWKSLGSSNDKEVVAEAKKGLQQASRQIRIRANEHLSEAKSYAKQGEVNSVLRLGREALKLYKAYGGNNGQLGDAHGVIGRSYLNGHDYATAKDHLKKAVQLAPGTGYETYLNQANSKLQPVTYINRGAPVRTQRTQTSTAPSFDLGSPSYQKGTRTGGGSRRTSSSSSSSAPAASNAAPKRMQEIPAYRPAQNRDGGGRKGSKGVLKGY